jgi:hypothetical protein
MNAASKLIALADRLKAGEYGFEIDRDVGLALGVWSYLEDNHQLCKQYPNTKWIQADDEIFEDSPGSLYSSCYSESIDAVQALAARLVPAAGWSIVIPASNDMLKENNITMPSIIAACFDGNTGRIVSAMAETEAASRLAALLTYMDRK